MNTDRLIDMLSIAPERVDSGRMGRVLLLAILASGAAAVILMLATVGPRTDLQSSAHLQWVAIKVFFALSVVGVGMPVLNRSIRPGLEGETNWLLLLLPFLGASALAVAWLLLSQPEARGAMLRGASSISSARCLLCIMFLAAIPMATVISAVRKGAPTRLRLSGGIVGMVAGGIGAAAYAFNCSSDTIPFIALWYGMAIALCAAIGAQLGPRVLRW